MLLIDALSRLFFSFVSRILAFQSCLKGEMMCQMTMDSRLWFMTELCSDGDLNRYILKIQETKTAAENSLINAQICIQMLDGLKFLHHVSLFMKTRDF